MMKVLNNNVCVVVPVYKVEKYLNRCIDSILNQTYKDFVLVLVDDGSPDNCGKICDEYAEKDDRIVVIHQENQGLSAARNAGIDWAFEHPEIEWITFIDSDDWVDKDYLKLLFDACILTKTHISVCGYKKTGDMEYSVLSNQNTVISPEKLWAKNNVNAVIACCKLYWLSLFKEVRYPVGKIHEDEFTTYRLLFSCDNIAYVESTLYFYFNNPNSIMNTKWNIKRLDCIEALEQQLAFFRKNKLDNAYKTTALLLRYCFFDNIIELEYLAKSDPSFIPEYQKLIKRYRMYYLKNKKILHLSIRENKYELSYIFPTEIRIYEIVRRKIKHFRTLFP